MSKGLGMGKGTDPKGNAGTASPLDEDFFEDESDLGDENVGEDGEQDEDYNEDEDSGEDGGGGENDVDDDEVPDKGAKATKFAGMYNSVEELEAAYKKLQTQYQSTKKSLIDVVTEKNSARIDSQPSTFTELDPTLVAQAMAENPAETMKLLMEYGQKAAAANNAKESDTVALRLEMADCKAKYADFDDYADAIAAVIENSPEILGLKNRFDVAYKIAKSEGTQSVVNKAVEKGRQQGYATARTKEKLTATGGKGSQARRTQPKTYEDELVDDMMDVVKNRGGF